MPIVLNGTTGITINELDPGLVVTSSETIAANNSNVVFPTTAAVDAHIPAKLNAGGTAPLYACRSWGNFGGVTTATIRASGNVASVVRNSAGNYTVTMSTAMLDADYSVVATAGDSVLNRLAAQASDFTTTSFRIYVINHGNGIFSDASVVTFAVFR